MGFSLGEAPYLICDSLHDKRFSPVHARVWFNRSMTIRQAFESMTSESMSFRMQQFVHELIWLSYLEDHDDLVMVLIKAPGVMDTFGRAHEINTAQTLWNLRARLLADYVKDL
jgi:hypothetical protein